MSYATATAIQRKIPQGWPAIAMVAATDPMIAGTSEPKIVSPRGANGPIKPVLIPLTASFEPTPSFSSMARSKPAIMVWKNGEVLKN